MTMQLYEVVVHRLGETVHAILPFLVRKIDEGTLFNF